MSEFSEEVRRLIEQSGTNVYQIARRSGLDRTTLQKMVQGHRLPSQQFVEQLCEYLLINKAERDGLMRLFRIEKIGRDRYECRLEVEKLLCDFRDLRDGTEGTLYRRTIRIERLDMAGGCAPAVRRLQTKMEVKETIQYVTLHACEDPAPEQILIFMDSFPKAAYAVRRILINERKERVRCCQFAEFYHTNGSGRGLQKNIRTLREILSCAFAFPEGYESRYFYRTLDEPDPCRIWPHYLVTEKNVLLLDADGAGGILIEDDAIAAEYLARLSVMRREGKNLLTCGGSPGELLNSYGTRFFPGRMTASFDTMLCMADLIPQLVTPEEVKESELLRSYLTLVARRDEADASSVTCQRICGMRGLEDFMRTGVLPGIFGELIGPIAPRRRAEAMRAYCSRMRREQNECLLSDEVPIPADGLNVELCAPDRVLLYSLRQTDLSAFVCIEEPGAHEAFEDYFESLAEDGRAYDPQESCRIVSERVEALIRRYHLTDPDAGGA